MTTQRNISEAKLSVGALARFATGLDWNSILAIGGHSSGWWRHAVVDAEGRGLLVWSGGAKVWMLTPTGRALTRSVS